jgi:hypothetical protein
MGTHLRDSGKAKGAVAVGNAGTGPEPTLSQQWGVRGGWAVLVNLGPKASGCGIVKEHREPPTLGVMRRGVHSLPSLLSVA